MYRTATLAVVIVLSILLGIYMAVDTDMIMRAKAENASPSDTLTKHRDAIHAELAARDLRPFEIFTRVAEMVQPSVVHISVEKKITLKEAPFPGGRIPFLPGPVPGPRREYRQRGEGSGMIVSKDGYVITNCHVVKGSTSIMVHLWDGRAFAARVKGRDTLTDIALLKIEEKELAGKNIELVPVIFGDSSRVKKGEWVLALGNPFGLENTLTVGVVSAVGRSHVVSDPGVYENFIQTDAAINKGNSGGPLLNLRGEVIGMNTAIWTESAFTEGFIGLGFAIPSRMITYVVKQLKEKGFVTRGWLGVKIGDVTPEVARALALDLSKPGSMKGAHVIEVLKNSPAEAGGIKKDDIIVSVNGVAISDAGHLRAEVAMTPIGSRAAVEVKRGNKIRTLTVVIGNREKSLGAAEGREKPLLFGMRLRNLSRAEAERFGCKRRCVQVIEVEKDSPAHRAGIQPLDIILKVGLTPVETIGEFIRETNTFNLRSGIPLVVLDEKGQHAVELKEK